MNSRFLNASKAVRKGLTEKPGRRARASKRQHRLLFETLEDRRLLAFSPALIQTIEGFSINDNAFNNNAAIYQTPDPHGAVGPNHIVNVGNQSIQWFTKAGVQHMQTSLRNFFGPLNADYGISNPKVVYDQYANRFVVAALETYLRQPVAPRTADLYDMSRIMVAVSDDADPNGTWYYYSINSMINVPDFSNPGEQIATWTDYMGIGLDRDALYFTGNLFPVARTGTGATRGDAQGSRLWIVDKGLGSGGLYDRPQHPLNIHTSTTVKTNVWDAARTAGVDYSGNYTGERPEFRSMQPAHIYGNAPAGVGTWLVMYDGMNNGVQEIVDVVRVTNPLAPQPTFKHFPINVGDIEDTLFYPVDFSSPQRQTVAPINGGDRRITSVVWRDNSLYATTVIYPRTGPDSNQLTTHWFRFDTSNHHTITLADQGSIGGEELGFAAHTIWPAVNVDQHGNMVVGFTATGPNLYPGSYYAVRSPSDAPGTTRLAGTLAVGQDSYTPTGIAATSQNPWGRYTSVALDPTDGVTFWLYNSYALPRQSTVAASGRWGTRWGSLRMAEPPPVPQPGPVTISGVVWEDQDENRQRGSTEVGLGDWVVYVDLNGNGEREANEPAVRTDSAGRYTIYDLPFPTNGTYIVRQAVKPGWRQTFPAQPPNQPWPAHVLSITSGGTIANVNFGNSARDGFDWGDAPAPYPTLRQDNGPRHVILPGFGLGLDDGVSVLVDGEPDGIPHPEALGDDLNNFDDENGVVFTTPLIPGRTATITVTVSTGSHPPGMLQGWIDFAGNGNWTDPGDQVFRNLVLGQGVHALQVQVPSTAVPGKTFARFRYGYEMDLSFVGPAYLGGEVEDYVVHVVADNPVARDDNFNVEQDSRDNIFPVLANDSPSTNGLAALRLHTLNMTGASGTAFIDRNNTPNDPTDDFIRYTPAPFTTFDSFSYTIQDIISGATSTATVFVTITDTGGLLPVAVDDSYTLPPPNVPPELLDNPTDPYLLDVLRNDRIGPAGPIFIPPNGLDTSSTIGGVALEWRTVGNRQVQMVRYTPPSPTFSGTDQFRYMIEDSNGNRSTATVNLQMGNDRTADDIVRYRLVTADMNGNPITSIGQGMQFRVLAYVQDVRNEPGYLQAPSVSPNQRGVYSAYMDLLYDTNFSSFVSVSFPGNYNEGTFYDASVPGILNEVGAIQGTLGPPLGPTEQLVFSAVFTANAMGTARFKSDPADVLPLHETAVNTPAMSIGHTQIDFGATTINIVETPQLAQIRLEATNLQGTPLAPNQQLAAGTQFFVNAWVDDIRTTIPANQQGVFSAYLDILYNSALAQPVTDASNPLGFAITAGPLFQGQLKGVNLPGIVDEVGAFQGFTAQTFSDERLLFQIRFVTLGGASGSLVFTADRADNLPLNETTLIKPDPGISVPPAQIRYVNSSPIVVIGGSGEGEFTNPANRFDVNNDGHVTPMDVLLLINLLNLTGTVNLSSWAAEGEGVGAGAGAATGPYYDVNGDGYISPLDVLEVINTLNRTFDPTTGEGESLAEPLHLTRSSGESMPDGVLVWAAFDPPEFPIALGSESGEPEPSEWFVSDEGKYDALADAGRHADELTEDLELERLLDDDLADDIASAWRMKSLSDDLLAELV